MKPAVSVLVCTRNRGEKITRAVDSILANTFADFELVIVDQSVDDVTSKVINTYSDPRIRYLRSDTVGLSRSRNIAIRESRAEIVVFTDDDCVSDKEWLSSIDAEYERDPSLMGVYGRVLPYGIGKPGMFCHCLIDSMERRTVEKPVIPYAVLGHGNNMSFKKDVFKKVGLYIESLGAGTWMKSGEDTDVTYRALKRNMKLCYSPAPLVYHDNWLTLQEAMLLDYGYMLGGIAVLTKYSLMGDSKPLPYIFERTTWIADKFYEGVKNKNIAVIIHSIKLVYWFALGLITGVKYLFVPAPQLETSIKE